MSQARLGLIVARRRVPRAVDRNRLKRRIRESYRRWQWQLPGRDLVVQVNEAMLGADQGEVTARLDQLWGDLINDEQNADRGH